LNPPTVQTSNLPTKSNSCRQRSTTPPATTQEPQKIRSQSATLPQHLPDPTEKDPVGNHPSSSSTKLTPANLLDHLRPTSPALLSRGS
jgi:hypothetical protein